MKLRRSELMKLIPLALGTPKSRALAHALVFSSSSGVIPSYLKEQKSRVRDQKSESRATCKVCIIGCPIRNLES
jgi:hypothetical protein